MPMVNEHINLILASDNPYWDPSSTIYAQQESAMTNWKGEIRIRKKPNWEVLSFKVPLPPRPKTITPTAQPKCMNDWTITLPESTLKNNMNSIASHAVREGVATGEWLTGYEPKDKNVPDLLTKTIPGGERRTRLVHGVMYYIGVDWLCVFTPWEFPHG